MKLHRIALTDFRGVESSEVSFEAPGVTVVVGPNEIGKSSLAEALMLVRAYKDSSKHRDVVAVKPTHRDVGPQVEIEVQTGPYRFVYTKRWLKRPSTELRITAPRSEQLTGDEAHERVEQMFAATLDQQLWSALQQVQGASLQQPDLAEVTPLHAALSAASEADEEDDHADLMRRIESRYREFFTKTGSPTGDFARSVDVVTALHDELQSVETRLRGVDDRVERHARLIEQRARLADRVESAGAQLEDLGTRFAAIAELRAAVDTAHGRLREAQLAETAARSAVQARADRERDVHEAQLAVAKASEILAAADEAHTAHADEQSELAEAHDAARARLDQARTGLAEARAAFESARARNDLAGLTARVEAGAAVSARLEQLASAIEANGLDARALQRITDAHAAAQAARAAASSGAARVAVQRLGEAAVHIDGEPVGDQTSADVVIETTIEAADVVRVVVVPDASAAERTAEADRLSNELDGLLSEAGVADLAAARSKAADRDLLREQSQRAEAELEGLLGDDSIQALRGRASALAERLGDDEEKDDSTTDDIDAVLRAAQEEFDDAQAAIDSGGTERDVRSARGDELRAGLIRAQTQLDGAQQTLERAQQRLDTDRQSDPDDALEAALGSTEAELAEATEAAFEARQALDEHDADVIETELINAREAQTRHAAELGRLTVDIAMVEGELEALGRDGLRDAVDDARSRLDDASRWRDSLTARAEAARLLFETMSAHQLAARQQYVAPFRASITSLGKVVFGPDFSAEIGDDLSIVSRTLDGVTVPFESLSGGAREQLAVIGRLATARLVSDDLGAPVILDDSLGFTDAVRRRKLAAVINRVGASAQIIILTCDPDRFADIGSVTTVHLG